MNGFVSNRNARGITMISFILVLCVVGFFASILMVLWGPYFEYRNVISAIDTVAAEPGAAQKDIVELRRSLQKRFDVGYVDTVNSKDATIVQDATGNRLDLAYEVRKHYMANIDIVMVFDHSAPLNSAGASSNP